MDPYLDRLIMRIQNLLPNSNLNLSLRRKLNSCSHV